MTDPIPFLKDLLSAPGLSGYEDPVAKIIEEKWRPLVHEISRGKLGSLHGLRHGTGEPPRPSVMVASHMDAIGLMVTGITEGFLRISEVGGVDARILPGTPVNVFSTGPGATKVLPGLVALPSAPLLPEQERDGPVALEHLLVDTGLLPPQVSELVRVGDLVSFAQPPVELNGETLTGHSLDNRASLAALTICLEELQTLTHSWDVWAVATSQEEVGLIGAGGSAFEIHPSMVIVVDVTFAKAAEDTNWRTFPLGKGPTIAMGPNMHPALHKAMRALADRLEIPYTLEYDPTYSGTDAWATQVAAEGLPTMVLGIPLRYMHMPVEVAAIKDIQRAGRLLAGFISSLGPDFIEKMVWE
ncbi:MAG: M42 family peptidase [Anaerolineales bacterium]|jgi:endoglucanase